MPAISQAVEKQASETAQVNLSSYFRRIHYEGSPSPDLDTLKAIHRLHPQSIPFENLNPLLRLPVSLNSHDIQRKLIQQGRGGYCFEHNLLFRHVLEAIGFKVKGLAARVVWNVPEGVLTARGHMLLLVEVEGQNYLADVGFGGLTLTAPLLLVPDREQETPHELFRLLKGGEGFVLQARVKDDWKALYRFDMQEQFLPDYEVTNWYLSNHPNSHFVTGLIAARTDPGERFALRNRELAIHRVGGSTERQTLTTASALQSVLEDVFRITLPVVPGLEDTLKRIAEGKN